MADAQPDSTAAHAIRFPNEDADYRAARYPQLRYPG
jgi:hypothetical protein